MAKLIHTFVLKLSANEAAALKKFLGSFTDRQFKTHKITGENREHIRNIFDAIPYPDEENY